MFYYLEVVNALQYEDHYELCSEVNAVVCVPKTLHAEQIDAVLLEVCEMVERSGAKMSTFFY
jgi:hypothetical protein